MKRIVSARALPGYRVWLRFADGVEGTVDLSELKGQGVFSAWQDEKIFLAVSVDAESHALAWPGGIDLCPDSLYAELTGKTLLAVSGSCAASPE